VACDERWGPDALLARVLNEEKGVYLDENEELEGHEGCERVSRFTALALLVGRGGSQLACVGPSGEGLGGANCDAGMYLPLSRGGIFWRH
jgi:hypothetical protein